jgi:hypothetical protein
MQSRMRRANRRNSLVVSALLLGAAFAGSAYSQSRKLDLSNAAIVHSSTKPRQTKAAEFLQYEVQRRTGISLAASTSMPAGGSPAIVIGTVGTFPIPYTLPAGLSVPAKAEGYAIWIDRTVPTVYLVGRDDRGALFAVCRLIRLLYLAPGHIHLVDDIRIATAPDCAIRAHQIIRSTQCEDGFVDWAAVRT